LNEQSGGVCGRQKEIGRALDEGLVVIDECRPRQFFFEAVGNAAAIEPVLKTPIACVIHDAVGHCALLSAAKAELPRSSR
jgi:hypothetical protein